MGTVLRVAKILSLPPPAVEALEDFVGSDTGATAADDVANMEDVSSETITLLTTGKHSPANMLGTQWKRHGFPAGWDKSGL